MLHISCFGVKWLYKTTMWDYWGKDVERYGGVKVVCTVPTDAHKDIIYPAAVTTMDDSSGAAQAFLDWCTTDPDAQEIWGKWGFELI